MISHTMLVATCAFDGRLSARRVASAIARGLTEGGLPEPDQCPLELAGEVPADVRALLDRLDFDRRMRRARAVLVGVMLLEERTLAGSVTFEIATRARQAGVPTYAIAARNELSPFDARILDLQLILEAAGPKALVAAARELAGLV
ncbi:MAG: glycerate kinase [Solirubrobacteraceae bacterium]